MDDEQAAITAAIAASLAHSAPHTHTDNHNTNSSSEEEDDCYPVDDDEDDMSSSDSIAEVYSSLTATAPVLMDIDSVPTSTPVDMGTRILIPSRHRDPVASSVESVSSSYLERMDSRFRSSTNPEVLESRRLRQEQDDLMAQSLQDDRRRIRDEEAVAASQHTKKAVRLAAEERLPREPDVNDTNVLAVALRLPSGGRLMRRFQIFDRLRSVADLAIAENGCAGILDSSPSEVLKVPGESLAANSWDVALGDLGLGRRTMFILNLA